MVADYVAAEELMVLATDNLRKDLRLLQGLQQMGVLVNALYGSTSAGRDDAIRNVVIDAVLQRIVDGENSGLLRDAMERHGEFAAELMIRYNKRAMEVVSDAKGEFEKMKSNMARDAKAEHGRLKRQISRAESDLASIQARVQRLKDQLTEGQKATSYGPVKHNRFIQQCLAIVDTA
jgi:hypothetical protein